MRLRRVDAVRYGSLPAEASLGELGEGLTVVLGPNEAGKTSYTTLVRHVLFGFPNQRSTERLFLPPNNEKRVGRLVFADGGGGEWVVERADGVRGGTPEVRGPDGDGFLEKLTAGVGADVYRSVFGFGLDELGDLASLNDIQQRLYATAAGLRVDPQDVRKQLKERAEALWSAQGRTKVVHRLNSELGEVRARVREAQKRADAFREERAELDRLVEESGELDTEARARRVRAVRLGEQAATARQLEIQVRGADAERERLRNELDDARAAAERLDVDEGLIERAGAIDELATRLEWFQDAVKRAEAGAEKAREACRALDDSLKSLGGWEEERLDRVPTATTLEAELDVHEERLRETRHQAEEALRLAGEARDSGSYVRCEADEIAEALALDATDPQQDAEVRLGAVIELLRHGAAPNNGLRLPAIVAGALALVLAVAGVLTRDWLVVAAALLPLGLAAWLAFGRGAFADGGSADLLRAARLQSRPDAGRLLALQSDLQRYMALSRTLWEADGKLAVVDGKSTQSERRAAETAEEWREWLSANGLEEASEPRAGRALLREVRRAQQARERLAEAEDEAAAARTQVRGYGQKAHEAGLVKASEVNDAVLVASAVREARDALEATRTAGRRAGELAADGDRITGEMSRLEERTARSVKELDEILREAAVEGEAGVAELEVLAEQAAEEAEQAEELARQALQRRSELAGRLDAAAEDAEGARARVEEAGLVERLGAAVEEYAVTATALALVEETLALYERERQPAIVKRAEEIFRTMTDGRYHHVITPLGSFSLSVEDEARRSKDGGVLSRGTAEQLYLALRLAYIENLRDVHPGLPVLMDDVLVNFDDEGRQAAAAAAIAEFAQKRQVVFFTCHERVADLFAESDPDHTRLTLERC